MKPEELFKELEFPYKVDVYAFFRWPARKPGERVIDYQRGWQRAFAWGANCPPEPAVFWRGECFPMNEELSPGQETGIRNLIAAERRLLTGEDVIVPGYGQMTKERAEKMKFSAI